MIFSDNFAYPDGTLPLHGSWITAGGPDLEVRDHQVFLFGPASAVVSGLPGAFNYQTPFTLSFIVQPVRYVQGLIGSFRVLMGDVGSVAGLYVNVSFNSGTGRLDGIATFKDSAGTSFVSGLLDMSHVTFCAIVFDGTNVAVRMGGNRFDVPAPDLTTCTSGIVLVSLIPASTSYMLLDNLQLYDAATPPSSPPPSPSTPPTSSGKVLRFPEAENSPRSDKGLALFARTIQNAREFTIPAYTTLPTAGKPYQIAAKNGTVSYYDPVSHAWIPWCADCGGGTGSSFSPALPNITVSDTSSGVIPTAVINISVDQESNQIRPVEIHNSSNVFVAGFRFNGGLIASYAYDLSDFLSVSFADRALFRTDNTTAADWQSSYLGDAAGDVSVQWLSRQLKADNGLGSMIKSVDWSTYELYRPSGGGAAKVSIDWSQRWLVAESGITTVGWEACDLSDNSLGNLSIDWANRQLIANDGTTVILDWSDPSTIIGGGTSGGVTSVALSMPSIFHVAGSPITGAGTFTVTNATENQNTVWAAGATASGLTPSFRTLTLSDLPPSLVTSSGVTSVALTAPSIFVVSGSPVTSTGTLAFANATQNKNLFWLTGATANGLTPTFRAAVAADLGTGTPSASTFLNGTLGWATPTATVTSPLKDSGGTNSVDFDANRYLYDAGGNPTVKWADMKLQNPSSGQEIAWGSGVIKDASGVTSIDWVARVLSTGATAKFNWNFTPPTMTTTDSTSLATELAALPNTKAVIDNLRTIINELKTLLHNASMTT